MYIFSFNRFAGFDRVFKLDLSSDSFGGNSDNIKSGNNILQAGNLIKYQDDFFLILGKEISFEEQYNYEYKISNKSDCELIYKGIFSQNTLKLIHWMVYWWYSNYKSVLRYFIDFDVDKLLKISSNKKTSKKNINIKNNKILTNNGIISFSNEETDGQQFVIFPDLWSLYNMVDEKILTQKGNTVLASNDSQNQKNKKWRGIKNAEIKNVFCTHSEIFQDWKNLKEVVLIDPHKRYYENQQDPRYKVEVVVNEIGNIYGANIILL